MPRKKISVQDLQLGMYVDELVGSWMDHPFWKTSFKLHQTSDLAILRNCSIREVWIDTSKGRDVGEGVTAHIDVPEDTKIERTLVDAANEASPRRTVTLEDELVRARKLQAKATSAVVSMFQEARMGKAIDVSQAAQLIEEINRSIARNADALLSLARLKNADDYTYMHSVAVCALMIALGRQLGIDSDLLASVGMAGMLHDIGKIAIPDKVLNKPGKLTDHEFMIVRTHPKLGWDMLKVSPDIDELALDVCLHHHERADGTGYPDRISGDALTLFERMGAVCDVYDAITSARCYKPGWAPAQAIRKMAEWRDGHFDPVVFDAFVKTVGIYPSGTLVKLQSQRLGVVTDQSENSLLTPCVKVFFSTRSNAPIRSEIVDLAYSEDTILGVEDPAVWKLDLKRLVGI